MCGICGVFIHNQSVKLSDEILKGMTDTLKHRGPDDEGFYVEDFVGLGHRRLSIIDLSMGHQPIFNEDKSKVIIFNGEIYNYQGLRTYLLKKKHKFTTFSDTEVILHLYEEFGSACVEKLRGMFAFAIYDIKNKSLYLARDRLGIKPLYYYHHNGMCLFGSEIKAILNFDSINKELDYEALSDYLSYLYIPAPKTIFRYIKKLPAGHWLLYQNDELKIQKYWDISFDNTLELKEDQWINGLYDHLEQSVQMRLMSEVPLGAFLSGGIDSSIVVAIMSILNSLSVITNSIGFTDSKFNELEYAKETSDYFHTDHHQYVVTPNSVEILDKLAWYFDEPFADSSALPTYYVSKVAKENVTVALSGDGGDENFAGYRRYYFDVLENKIRGLIPSAIRRTIIQRIADIYPKADWLPQYLRAKTLLQNISTTPVEGYFQSMTHLSAEQRESILNPDIYGMLNGYASIDLFKRHYENSDSSDLLSKVQYVDIKTYLVDDILTKVDRASMAHSLEVRVPLLDHVFMEYVAQMPSNLKLNGKTSKYIFKEMTKKLLPEKILNRKKMGFTVPVDEWFRTDLKALYRDEVLSASQTNSQYFNIDYLRSMWQQHQRGHKNYGVQFWAILMFVKWAKNFLND